MNDVSKADTAIDRASGRLRDASESLDERGGLPGKLAGPLAEDADFLPKLDPSLIEERLKENPTGSEPASESSEPSSRPKRRPARSGHEKASGGKDGAAAKRVLPLVAGAFAAGVVLAKVIDWRGHAHPRD